MAVTLHGVISRAFSWMKIFEFWQNCYILFSWGFIDNTSWWPRSQTHLCVTRLREINWQPSRHIFETQVDDVTRETPDNVQTLSSFIVLIRTFGSLSPLSCAEHSDIAISGLYRFPSRFIVDILIGQCCVETCIKQGWHNWTSSRRVFPIYILR